MIDYEYPPCLDSSNRFQIARGVANDTNSVSCEWVGRFPLVRCNLDPASSRCPYTCSRCKPCEDVEDFFSLGSGKETISCKWVREKPLSRCKDEVSEKCPSTCNSCPFSFQPTSPPTLISWPGIALIQSSDTSDSRKEK